MLSDKSGIYEARRLPGGKKWVVIMTNGYNMVTKGFELASGVVKSGIDFKLEKSGSVSGYIVDEENNPIGGARIKIVYKDPLPFSPLRLDFWHTGTKETSKNGFFYVGNIQSGLRFVLKVVHKDYKLFVSPIWRLEPGERAEGLRIVLERK